MAAMKENTRKIFDYVKEHDGEDFTAKDIAAALDLNPKSVNGSITAFAKKKLMDRVEAEIENADGTHDKVKLIQLTDAGREFDPDAEEAKAE